jgi:signal transduction histidine kinase/ActR/RegA family two-component response regulator
MTRPSLTRRLLAAILLAPLAISMIAAVIAAVTFTRMLESQHAAGLDTYIAERSQRANVPFATIRRAHEAARSALLQRLELPVSDDTEARFNILFPRREDGTRRSIDALFEGYVDHAGEWHSGVGAFFNSDRTEQRDVQHLLLNAYNVVDGAGEMLSGRIDNIYFFSAFNELVISASDRPDQLRFYRHDAPANFDLQNASFTRLVHRDTNPDGRFVCGELSRAVYIEDEQALTTGCFTPVRDGNRHLGAIGSTLDLSTYFESVITDAPDAGQNIMLDRHGNLIAQSELLSGTITPALVAELEAALDIDSIFETVAYDGRERAVLPTSDGRWLLAYSVLDGPGWYFVTIIDQASLRSIAAIRTLWIFGFTLVGVIVLAALIYQILSSQVIHPLVFLAKHFGRGPREAAAGGEALDELLADKTELGVLARALEAQKQSSVTLVDELADGMEERTRALAEANASKNVFLANMSHELRTPLNGILGLAQALESSTSDAAQRDRLRMIRTSGDHLATLLDDILDMSKIEAGKLELNVEPADLHELLNDTFRLFQESAALKSLDFDLVIDDSLPRYVAMDGLRVKQCLSNLISNAIKFTQVGRVTVHAKASSGVNFHDIRIAIEDSGIGMEDATIDRLFTAFTQADSSITPRFGGTGLGLAISRDLARLMDGDVSVTSAYGEGSTFELQFLAAHAGPIETKTISTDPHELASAPEFADLHNLRILLVEDNMINRTVARALLAPLKAEITEAENGQEALMALGRNSFDLALMDVRMPIMDGVEATQQIRERSSSDRHLPVIAVTASLSDLEIARYRAAGMDAVTGKPLKAAELYTAMRDVLTTPSERQDPTLNSPGL